MYNISILPKSNQSNSLCFRAKTPKESQPTLPNDEVIISSNKKKKTSIPWKSILTVGAVILVVIDALSEHKINKDLNAKIEDLEKSKEICDKSLSELEKYSKKIEEDFKKQEEELKKILKNLEDSNKK